MRYYPVFLDMVGKAAVVIGGGRIALQKIEGLVEAGADVTVISPEVLPAIDEYVKAGKVKHIRRVYEPGDLEGYVIAFAATDDGVNNAAVREEGRQRRVWVNAVDDPPNCDFIMPGVIRRGELIVAISTSGLSPAMARKAREQVEECLTEEDSALLGLAAEVRQELREKGIAVQACNRCDRDANDVWNAALDGEVKRLLSTGEYPAAKQRLLKSLLAPSEQA
jgi:precorrin-2 dehydrogenase/sirohydrochlorin ferrochelatase